MSENPAPRGTPTNPNDGCFNCGGGKEQPLISKTVGGTSVALCAKCEDMQTVPRMPFDYRNAN